jgi:hypothetical protein
MERDIFSGNCLEFASYYQDKMVLQREPASAVIWGTGELLGEVEAILDCSLQGTQNYTLCVTLLLNSLVLLCFTCLKSSSVLGMLRYVHKVKMDQ